MPKQPNKRKQQKHFDFEWEFKRFLTDDHSRRLLQEAICTPLLKQIDLLHTALLEKDQRISLLYTKIDELSQKNDDLEQYTRRNSVRIVGISEEDKEDCDSKVLDLVNETMSLAPRIELSDLDRVHRIGRKGNKDRPMIVKFTSYRQRSRVIKARSALKDVTPKIFINDDLTSKRATLLWKARMAKTAGRLKDCWSSDGRIVIKDMNDQIHTIRCDDDLNDHADTWPKQQQRSDDLNDPAHTWPKEQRSNYDLNASAPAFQLPINNESPLMMSSMNNSSIISPTTPLRESPTPSSS